MMPRKRCAWATTPLGIAYHDKEWGVPANSKVEQKVYSAAKPDFFRIYRFEMASEVVRSVPTGVDRVSQVSFKATGGALGALFDGSQQLISVTSIPWYSRQVFLPAL